MKSQASAPQRNSKITQQASEKTEPLSQILAWPDRSLEAGDMVTAFAIANPGLEDLVEHEVVNLWPASQPQAERGGVTFQVTLGDLHRRLPELRVATRVLIRVAEFVAKDFPKLHKRTLALGWRHWLAKDAEVKVKVASQASRLKIKRRVEEVVAEAIEESRPPTRGLKTSSSLAAQIYVRLDQDRAMISVDASGELMHKRGDREEVGRAPLRETWAAAVVQRLRALLDRTAESSWMWIEPMAGTAVFAREWRAERPQRDWALGRMILFRQQAELASESDQTAHGTSSVDPIAHWCFAESNPARRQGLKVWLAEEESATLAESSRQLGEILNGVLASSSSGIQAALPRVVVVNPPWGVRLKSPEAVPTRAKQAEFLEDLEKNFGPAIVAVVFPRTREGLAGAPAGWREMKPLQFKVGGLPVVARFFEVRARLPR